jgi:hypothetical protein
MALLWFDGCGEYYGTNEITRVWNSRLNATVDVGTGRRSGNCIKCTAQTHHVWKGFENGSPTTVIVGFAMKIESTLPTDTNFVRLYGDGTNHLSFFVRNNGACGIDRGSTEMAVSSAGIWTADVWKYVELKVLIDNTTLGTVEVRVDGVTVASATGLDTRNGGTTDTVNAVQFSSSASQTVRYDDVYICDTTTAIRNDFLGDTQCDVVLADGDGATSAFDTTFPASPTTHYTKVDEATPNDDTDYNETPTNADVDLFTYAALPAIAGSSSVKGVKVAIMAKKNDAGACNIRAVARPVSINRNGPTSFPLQVDYDYKQEIWAQNPETSADWTDALINASEFGVEKIA